MKEENDIKENTSLITIIIIGLFVVICVIAFMLLGNDKSNTTEINDNKEQTETITMSDIAGKYYGEHTSSNEEQTEKSDSLVDDAKDTVDDVTDAVTEDDKTFRIELELDLDGSGKIVNTKESKEVLKGTYTLTDKMITFVVNVDEENTNIKTTSYMFTVNSDKSLTYNRIGDNFVLIKATSDELKYIK